MFLPATYVGYNLILQQHLSRKLNLFEQFPSGDKVSMLAPTHHDFAEYGGYVQARIKKKVADSWELIVSLIIPTLKHANEVYRVKIVHHRAKREASCRSDKFGVTRQLASGLFFVEICGKVE